MGLIFDAFFRALAYCLMPRVVLLSALPLLLMMGGSGLLAWLYWEDGVATVRQVLEDSATWGVVLGWLDESGGAAWRAVLAPLILVGLTVPVLVVACLLLVAVFMTPTLVKLVAARRFEGLARRGEGAVVWPVLRSLFLSVAAVVAVVLSLPLWLLPPLGALVPPLVWGWLTVQTLSWDVMGEHATAAERQALMQTHRWPLWTMGVVSGLLGSAPAAVWALGALTLVLAPLVMVASIWLYTIVFTFTSLWFAHYLLAALHERRRETDVEILDPAEPVDAAPTVDRAAVASASPSTLPRIERTP